MITKQTCIRQTESKDSLVDVSEVTTDEIRFMFQNAYRRNEDGIVTGILKMQKKDFIED